MRKTKTVVTVFLVVTIITASLAGLDSFVAKADYPQGAISITFDDGTISQYTEAFPVMQARGIVGTFYVITDQIRDFSGDALFMSIAELQTMQAAGNEIGSHSLNHPHLTELSDAEIHQQCNQSQQILQSYGFSALNFAYPFGDHDERVSAIADDYYNSARGAYDDLRILEFPVTQFDVPGFNGETGTPSALDRLRDAVDEIYSTNEWAIFYFHNVVDGAYNQEYTISTEHFTAFLDYIVSLGIPTITVQQGLNGGSNPNQRTLTILPSTGGTTTPPAGSYMVDLGTVITVTAEADSGYVFSNWVLDGANAGTSPTIDATMNANHVLSAVFTSTAPTPAVWNNGFEEGSFSAWDSYVGSSAVQSTVKHHGNYAARFSSTGWYCATYVSSPSTLFVREYVQIDALPPNNGDQVDVLRLQSAGFSNLVEVSLDKYNDVRTITLYRRYPSESWSGYMFDMQVGVWLCVEVEVVRHVSLGEYRLWLNGVEVVTETGVDTSEVDIGIIEVGSVWSTYSTNLYVDCVAYGYGYIGPEAVVSISPTSVTMMVGQSQPFNAVVSGGAMPFTYQWYLNGSAVPNTNSSTWNFVPTEAGHYNVYVILTDINNFTAVSNVTSDILVYPQLAVTISPTSVNMTVGGFQQFTSSVTGGATPYAYQWYLNDSQVPGATVATYTFSPSSAGSYSIYLVVTSVGLGSAQSNVATAQVSLPLVVSISPSNVKLYFGQSSIFSTSVSGGVGPYSYQWYLNGSAVSGATSATWVFTPRANGNYNVYVNVTDSVNNKAQSNVVSNVDVYSVYLVLNVEPNQAIYGKRQQVTLSVTIFNQQNPALDSSLILTITGPKGYSFCNPNPICVAANSVGTHSLTWVVPESAGTYVVEANLAPSMLTAYDAVWLKVA